MEWKQIESHWREVKGEARKHWDQLSDADLEQIAGHRERLVAKIRERYGFSAEDAEHRVDVFRKSLATPVNR